MYEEETMGKRKPVDPGKGRNKLKAYPFGGTLVSHDASSAVVQVERSGGPKGSRLAPGEYTLVIAADTKIIVNDTKTGAEGLLDGEPVHGRASRVGEGYAAVMLVQEVEEEEPVVQ